MSDEIRLGRHAQNKQRRWRDGPDAVTDELAADIIRSPDAVTPSIKDRRNAWRQIGPRWLRVTYAIQGTRIDVVTITWRDYGPYRNL